ncbi:MAG: hypothetical protein LBV33_05305 [Lachnospiraceae bacterium]|nr:hypothetical protein [Lachnospiraceae bacterium]
MKIDWKQKLSSRKFWVTVVGFISALGVALNVDPGSTERIAAIIMSGASLIAYTLSEGFVDGKLAGSSTEAAKVTQAVGNTESPKITLVADSEQESKEDIE